MHNKEDLKKCIHNSYGYLHTVKSFNEYLQIYWPNLTEGEIFLLNMVRETKMQNYIDREKEICAIKKATWLKNHCFDGQIESTYYEIKCQCSGKLSGKYSISSVSIDSYNNIIEYFNKGNEVNVLIAGFANWELIYLIEIPYDYILPELSNKLDASSDSNIKGSIGWCQYRSKDNFKRFKVLFINDENICYENVTKGFLSWIKE